MFWLTATNSLPETLVDHAEEIWSLLATGKTQQNVADEIGWSREKVAKYSGLESISPIVWKEIVTTFSKTVPNQMYYTGTNFVPVGTITEGLLRNILPLTEYHQVKTRDNNFCISNAEVDRISHGFIKLNRVDRKYTVLISAGINQS